MERVAKIGSVIRNSIFPTADIISILEMVYCQLLVLIPRTSDYYLINYPPGNWDVPDCVRSFCFDFLCNKLLVTLVIDIPSKLAPDKNTTGCEINIDIFQSDGFRNSKSRRYRKKQGDIHSPIMLLTGIEQFPNFRNCIRLHISLRLFWYHSAELSNCDNTGVI